MDLNVTKQSRQKSTFGKDYDLIVFFCATFLRTFAIRKCSLHSNIKNKTSVTLVLLESDNTEIVQSENMKAIHLKGRWW